MASGIYLILDSVLLGGRDPETAASAAASAAALAGASAVQWRAKDLSEEEILAAARKIVEALRETPALAIINDHPDIAETVGADGVHLGPDDMPVAAARRDHPDLIIGRSTNGPVEAARAAADGASYIAIGPVFDTITKKDTRRKVGLDGVKRVARAVAKDLPVVAVGGITPATAGRVLAAGATTVAVSSAVLGGGEIAANIGRFGPVIPFRGSDRASGQDDR